MAVVSPVSNSQVPRAVLSAALIQKPADKGTRTSKDAAKQKPAPPQPKEPVVDRPEPKEQPALPKDAEPAPTDEAAKPSTDAEPTTKDVEESEGPDALAKKFAELLEKRRAEAAAKAASRNGSAIRAAKEVPKQPEPVVEPAAKPEPDTERAAEGARTWNRPRTWNPIPLPKTRHR